MLIYKLGSFSLMPAPPLGERLKRRTHRAIALSQDVLMLSVYDRLPSAVLHGGTAIWRCYGSARFSEDIDIYLPSRSRKQLSSRFLEDVKRKGMEVEKFKIGERALLAKFVYLGVSVRLEAAFDDVKGAIVRPFEMTDGTSMMVNTLSAEGLLTEKVAAYRIRRKVRDLYDISFLLNLVEEGSRVRGPLLSLLDGFQPPVDEREIRALIIWGAVPKVEDMVEGIRRWAR